MLRLALPLLALAPLAAAIAGDAPPAERIEIILSNFKYDPNEIHMVHGRRYVLHFRNVANGGHDFVDKPFFAAAGLDPADRTLAGKGEVELGGGDERTVTLTAPSRGVYPFHCSHFLHQTFGMKGRIVVD